MMAVQMLQCKRTASSPIEGCNTSSGALEKLVQAWSALSNVGTLD